MAVAELPFPNCIESVSKNIQKIFWIQKSPKIIFSVWSWPEIFLITAVSQPVISS